MALSLLFRWSVLVAAIALAGCVSSAPPSTEASPDGVDATAGVNATLPLSLPADGADYRTLQFRAEAPWKIRYDGTGCGPGGMSIQVARHTDRATDTSHGFEAGSTFDRDEIHGVQTINTSGVFSVDVRTKCLWKLAIHEGPDP